MIGEIVLAIEMGADTVDIGKTILPALGESIGIAAKVAHGSCSQVSAASLLKKVAFELNSSQLSPRQPLTM